MNKTAEIITSAELKSIHWDIAKLLELGVNEEFVRQLTADETRELLKGLLYLVERYSDNVLGTT